MQRTVSLFAFLLPLFFLPCFGQINHPVTPQPKQFEPVSTTHSSSNPSGFYQNNTNYSAQHPSYQQAYSNQALAPGNQLPAKESASIQEIQQLLSEVTTKRKEIPTALPLLTRQKQYFDQAFSEISQMLEGQTTLDLKRAVFLTENAASDGSMDYKLFCNQIARIASLLQTQMLAENLPVNDPLAINKTVFRFICDTLRISSEGKIITTYPKTYDFNDPFGIKDIRQLFVSKLIKTGKGQCKSLPLLFLILVQEMHGEAWLSFAPSHSFIKCKDQTGQLFNLELTSGIVVSDSWIVGSGYVKAASVTTGIYLDTMNTKQVIANCLVDLSMYYSWRFGKQNIQLGYDEFNLQCLNKTLSVHPTNIHAVLGKSDYYTILLNYAASKKGYRTEQQLLADPVTAAIFRDRNKLYALTDQLGYEYFGEAEYQQWLKSLDPVPLVQPVITN